MEVIQGKCLQMGKEAVPQGFFDLPRRAKEKVSPEEAGHSDKESNPQKVECISKEVGRCDGSYGEIVNSPFDDAGDDELEEVNNNQRGQAKNKGIGILNQVWLDGTKTFHNSNCR
jgi:hypothetical protein